MPDFSTALPNQVIEMINADALVPLKYMIDDLGSDKFNTPSINEGTAMEIIIQFHYILMHKLCG